MTCKIERDWINLSLVHKLEISEVSVLNLGCIIPPLGGDKKTAIFSFISINFPSDFSHNRIQLEINIEIMSSTVEPFLLLNSLNIFPF